MRTRKIMQITAGMAGAAVLALAALTGARYQREMQEYRQRVDRLGSQVIDTACGAVEYAQAGRGYPVLVVHGNGGGFDQGLGLAQEYLGEDFQIIAPSRFGYLRTPLPAGASVADQADAYACLLDALKIQRAAVFTSSAGVTSSLQFAMRHPERVSALVLHSPNAPGKVEMKLPPRQVFSAMFHSDFAFWALMTYFGPSMYSFVGIPRGFALTGELEAYAKQALLSVLPSSERADGMIFDTFVSNPEINQYTFDKVSAPTLVVSAVDDPMALHENACALAAQIPGARLIKVKDGGHLMLGHVGEVKADINRFLSQAVVLSEK